MNQFKAVLLCTVILACSTVNAAIPTTGPTGENPGGIFATYFQNIANNPCTSSSIITSFSNTSDQNFLKANCTSIGTILGSFFTDYGVAGQREAVVGFDSKTGAPIFGVVGSQWQDQGTNLLYMSGNVGIGDSNPQSKLSILGSLNLADQSGNLRTDIGFYSGSGFRIYNLDNSSLILGTNNTEKMRIDSDGNVGIGTNNPHFKLEVSGDIFADNGWLRTSGSKGWYNETYGGGWTMTDSTWIQTVGDKSIYTSNILRADKGIYYSSDQKLFDGNNGWTYFTNSSNNYSNGLAVNKIWAEDSLCLAGVCKTAWSPGSQWGDEEKGISYLSGSVGIGTDPSRFKLEVAGDIYADNGWIRTSGTKGWYNETYGGGWTMTDSTWIRTHGGKSIYTPGVLHADQGIYYSKDQKFYDAGNGWTYFTDINNGYSNGLAVQYISANSAICLGSVCHSNWNELSPWAMLSDGSWSTNDNIGIGTQGIVTEKLEIQGNLKVSGTISSNGTTFKMPPVCTGSNKALQWDGNEWNCITINGTTTTNTTPTEQPKSSISLKTYLSNSPNDVSATTLNGTVCNDQTWYLVLDGVDRSNPPKGCAKLAGRVGCNNISTEFRDFTAYEWISSTRLVTTTPANLIETGNLEFYTLYGTNITKVGQGTLRQCTTPAPTPTNGTFISEPSGDIIEWICGYSSNPDSNYWTDQGNGCYHHSRRTVGTFVSEPSGHIIEWACGFAHAPDNGTSYWTDQGNGCYHHSRRVVDTFINSAGNTVERACGFAHAPDNGTSYWTDVGGNCYHHIR